MSKPTFTLPPGLDAKGEYVYLVDLSHWEPNTDFHALADAGISGIITKCTDGLSYVDPTYDVFRKKADIIRKERGSFFFGGYHFFRPELSPTQQAAYFLRHANPVSGDILPCLDSESEGHGVGTVSRVFAQTIYKSISRWPILYTGDSFYNEHLKHNFADGACPLWIARYGHRPATKCVMWQWTDQARIARQPKTMDADVYFGNIKDFKARLLLT